MPVPNELVIEKKEGQTFEPLPEDVYTLQLIDVELEEKPSYNDKTKMEQVFNFLFAVLDEDYRGRWMSRGFVPKYLYIGKKGKNALYEILEAMKGASLSDEEEAYMGGEYINDQIGKQVRAVIKQKQKDDKKYNNIESFMFAKNTLIPFTSEEVSEMLSKRAESKSKKDEGITVIQEEIKVEDVI